MFDIFCPKVPAMVIVVVVVKFLHRFCWYLSNQYGNKLEINICKHNILNHTPFVYRVSINEIILMYYINNTLKIYEHEQGKYRFNQSSEYVFLQHKPMNGEEVL